MTVAAWWAALCAMAACNLCAWTLAGAWLKGREKELPADAIAVQRLQFLLSGVYVVGCAFRSALPVFDIPRLCLADTWASSVLVGRTVATLAELAFATQWALFLRANSRGNAQVRRVSLLIVPLIAVAEGFSWHAVLTTANLGHVIENSLWGFSGLLIVACLFAIARRSPADERSMLGIWWLAGALYVGFMFLVDVPMYWERWSVDQARGREYLTLAQGIADAATCHRVSWRWQDWSSEVTWMSLYFGVGVWVSISLVVVGTWMRDDPARRKLLAGRMALR
jgi:hypothetical protein